MKKERIAFKLIFSVGAILIILLGFYTYLAVTTQKKEVLNEVVNGGLSLSETAKRSLWHSMLRNDREAIDQIIESVGEQENIHNVKIFNKEGVIVYSSDKNELHTKESISSQACRGCHFRDEPLENLKAKERTNIITLPNKERLLQLINPIYNQRTCAASECHPSPGEQKILGVLDMFISLKEIDQKTRSSQIRSIMISILSIMLISAIIFIYIRRKVVKPIMALNKGTRIISSGNLEYQIPVYRNDEIGRLATSFNQMNNTLNETRNQLLQSEKLASLGKLAAGVAHEINNPLTGVMLYTSSMMNELSEDDPNRENFNIVIDETKRCREIVKELLDFSRQTAPDMTMENIREVIEKILRIIHNQLVLKKLNVVENYGPDVPDFLMDSNKISQAILNLLINAVEASHEGGKITISTLYNSNNQVIITVSDEGKGIPKEDISRIFEPFFTTKGTKGTGLGMAVTWGIITQHDGEIRVASTEGKGATFTIYLPTRETHEDTGR